MRELVSKRLVGACLISSSLVGKVALFLIAVRADKVLVNFDNLDSSLNTLLAAGIGLLGFSVFDFLNKKK
jgi:hypothetical protein